MRIPQFALAAVALAAAAAQALAEPSVESHEITVRLVPDAARLEAEDKIVLRRDGGGPIRLHLHRHLAIASASVDGAAVEPKPAPGADDDWSVVYGFDVPAGQAAQAVLTIRYAGTIADEIHEGTAASIVHDRTRGLIAKEGVYLSEGTCWYPTDGEVARFTVHTHAVPGWEVVTQGTRTAGAEGEPTRWHGKYPADGLTLVAGPWTAKRRKVGDVEIGTYLTQANAAHADLLLDLSAGYLKKYGALLGPYAYDRFDVVDNFFTTGYGMPEYTLLGGAVIGRIVADMQRKGSVPAGYLGHEIVHCWWGNLVFPDYASGNWCEALTTYCSNYLEKEEESAAAAAEHRRITALRFALRATPAKDYPLRKFAEKREAADDDIGYGKGSMFFHTLRREIGDAPFWATLQRVARERRGQRVGWEDWRAEFEKTAKRSLAEQFAQGLDRPGAPLLELRDTRVKADGGRIVVSGTLRQTLAEGEKPWRLTVPVVVEHLGGTEELLVDLASAEAGFSIAVPSMPLRVAADPEYHVFRTLGPEEVPACFAATLARQDAALVVVYPDGDEPVRKFVEQAWPSASYPRVTVQPASAAPKSFAAGTSYVVFGDPDRVPLLASLRSTHTRHLVPQGAPASTVVLASSRNPADPNEFVTTLVGATDALAQRTRFVHYYQFDGRVVFEGPVPKDRTLGRPHSRTSRLLLPDLRAATSPERARSLVDRLAAPEMKGRLAGSPEEAKARRMVADELRLAGVEPREVPFTFAVKRVDPAQPVLTRAGGGAVEGVVPLVASPATPEDGTSVVGCVGDDDADVAGRALVVDIGAGSEKPLAFVREVAQLAVARRAAALFVRLPREVTPAIAELFEFPERLHPTVAARLEQAASQGGHGDPLMRAAGTAARIGSDTELPLPTVVVPADFRGAKDEILRLDVRFGRTEVASANLVARIRGKKANAGGPSVVVGAHVDHLGEGFPGGDDNASGVAALVEAANVLALQTDLLAADVTLVVFGAEEWGLRGSRAFVAEAPAGSVSAMLNADTVGRAGVDGVSVVGVTHHPRIARVVAAALEHCEIEAGREIDRYAFAHGSDHWSFHERGIPAVDLWSGDYGVMHTRRDTADGVDAAKVARVGRALALAALAVAGGS